MLSRSTFCAVCSITAAAGIGAAAVSLTATENLNVSRGRAALALSVACATAVLSATAWRQQVESQRVARQLLQRVAQEPWYGDKPVHIVVFRRDGCHHCMAFEHEDLPQLMAVHSADVGIEWREAASDVLTPTIMVLGRHVSDHGRLFIGRPAPADLRKAIASVAHVAAVGDVVHPTARVSPLDQTQEAQ
jgi:hypothetical protein